MPHRSSVPFLVLCVITLILLISDIRVRSQLGKVQADLDKLAGSNLGQSELALKIVVRQNKQERALDDINRVMMELAKLLNALTEAMLKEKPPKLDVDLDLTWLKGITHDAGCNESGVVRSSGRGSSRGVHIPASV